MESCRAKCPEEGTAKECDAIWVSSLCDSSFKGKPDTEPVDFTSRINTINEIMEVTTKPSSSTATPAGARSISCAT